MPTIAPHAHSPTEDSAFEILFDSDLLNYPDPDIIVRSSDLRELPLRKLYIVESSPVLRELIQAGPSCAVDTEPSSDLESVKMLPIVQLPDRADILSSLFSFVFPVPADLPPKLEQVVELLSVAQKYKMDVVLGRIRSHISIERPTLISKGNALLAFGLARKYGLRQEALQAARLTLGTRITLRDLETKLNSLPGTSFYEIWRYHQKVRQTLEAALRLFASSSVCLDFVRGSCAQGPEQQIPNWLRDYFNSITAHYTQALQVDPIEFHVARAHHVSGYGPLLGFVTNVNREKCLDCARVADGAVRTFCTALAAIIDGSILRASEGFFIENDKNICDRGDRSKEVTVTCLLGKQLDVRDGDVLLQSSDFAKFRVQKSTLAMSSPLFDDMFSLPQSCDAETIDGLPVVQVSEEAGVLNSLLTMLYPVLPIIPDSWDELLSLLSAAQKYDMVTVQSFLRTKINCGDVPAPTGKETFRVYALARKMCLAPEYMLSARLTLHHPMTFEFLGQDVGLFEGNALHELAQFRKYCRHSLLHCKCTLVGPNSSVISVWTRGTQPSSNEDPPQVGMEEAASCKSTDPKGIPWWIRIAFAEDIDFDFTSPLPKPQDLRSKIHAAIGNHIRQENCTFCARTFSSSGETFCNQVVNSTQQALDKALAGFWRRA